MTVLSFTTVTKLIGQRFDNEVSFERTDLVGSPWFIAENYERPVIMILGQEKLSYSRETLLVRDGKIDAVLLSLRDKQHFSEVLEVRPRGYIKRVVTELVDTFPPAKGKRLANLVIRQSADEVHNTEQSWSYLAQNKLTYTVCWKLGKYLDVRIESPQFLSDRIAEQERFNQTTFTEFLPAS